jgi:hypothetical protein
MRQDLNDMIGMLDATLTYLHEQRTSEARQWMDVQALVESMSEKRPGSGQRRAVSGTARLAGAADGAALVPQQPDGQCPALRRQRAHEARRQPRTTG